jgi:hypothetical protein
MGWATLLSSTPEFYSLLLFPAVKRGLPERLALLFIYVYVLGVDYAFVFLGLCCWFAC